MTKQITVKAAWVVDQKTNKELNFSIAFKNRTDAIEFARVNGLGLNAVKSRPAGYVVER